MTSTLSDEQTEFEEVQSKVKTLRLIVGAAFLVLCLLIAVSIGVVLYGWNSGKESTRSDDDLQKPRMTTPTNSAPSETTADTGKRDQVMKRVCDTEDCHYMRWFIDTSVDKSLDPCSNFFNYVCKGAVSTFNDKPGQGMLAHANFKIISDMEHWLINGHAQPRRQSAYQKVIATYQSCMNTSHQAFDENRRYIENLLKRHRMALTEGLDFDPMTKQLEFCFTDWPLIYNVETFPHRSSNEAFIEMRPYLVTQRTIQGNTSAERKEFVETVLKAIFALKDIDDATVNSVLDAEDGVFNLTGTMNLSGLIIPVAELGFVENDQTLARRWIHAISKYIRGDINQIKLSTTVGAATLFHDLFGSNAPIANETVETALAWMLTYTLYDSAGLKDYRNDRNLTRRRCLYDLFSIFPTVAGAKVLLEVVNRSRVDAVKAMTTEIGKEVEVSFTKSRWLDDVTKKRALEKVSRIIRLIGYHYDMMSPQEFDRYMRYVPDMEGVYIKNIIDAFAGKAKRLWESPFGNPNSLNLSIHHFTTKIPIFIVNAVNFVLLNAIFVPAATLSRPMFTYGGPPELNYGALGHIIAHEMMHSFDDLGVYFNGYGEFTMLYTPQSMQAFKSLQACHSDQIDRAPRARAFLQYPGEYLADTMAMESLTRAYKKASNISKVTLGNVKELTSDQLFYIAWCLQWCGVPAPGIDLTHPDLDERCNVPLMNSEHFSEAFSCRRDAPMNPSRKCHFF
ncbi:endothelin-converting enzyme 2-like [Ornithodoros turicata]|uniref:endothelin-converting enzyme 2-like n=1 Tax=Ornithodoros turicata TaxID=34597 RepID=UPI003138DF91